MFFQLSVDQLLDYLAGDLTDNLPNFMLIFFNMLQTHISFVQKLRNWLYFNFAVTFYDGIT